MPVFCTSTDYDTYDYNNLLRRGIIDAFSGIAQGFVEDISKGTNSGPVTRERLTAELPAVYQFLASIGADKNGGDTYDEDVAKAAISLLGDLLIVLPVRAEKYFPELCRARIVRIPFAHGHLQFVLHAPPVTWPRDFCPPR